ncbi:hypothetical protein [Sphingomonas guangdongensis]|uniref:hypothetical protein n=1 Tax=Sphingomonas guangdongensis TaxID=1141890 RepID=UPI001181C373|nr:hypothetical protein [Sphingomonas guangdongensis]
MALGELRPAMLSVGRYALRDRVRRSKRIIDRERVARALEETFGAIALAEPDQEEVALAADMEEEATRRSLAFDAGESQLIAIMLRRASRLLLTGDKRAVSAIHALEIEGADGRVACLEQLMATLLSLFGIEALRPAVCAEPQADRAVTACFSCAAAHVDEAGVRSGLASYVAHLRAASGSKLVPGDDLSAAAA